MTLRNLEIARSTALKPIQDDANGGGYSQVLPMEKLNLHLTGDMRCSYTAVRSATSPAETRLCWPT